MPVMNPPVPMTMAISRRFLFRPGGCRHLCFTERKMEAWEEWQGTRVQSQWGHGRERTQTQGWGTLVSPCSKWQASLELVIYLHPQRGLTAIVSGLHDHSSCFAGLVTSIFFLRNPYCWTASDGLTQHCEDFVPERRCACLCFPCIWYGICSFLHGPLKPCDWGHPLPLSFVPFTPSALTPAIRTTISQAPRVLLRLIVSSRTRPSPLFTKPAPLFYKPPRKYPLGGDPPSCPLWKGRLVFFLIAVCFLLVGSHPDLFVCFLKNILLTVAYAVESKLV